MSQSLIFGQGESSFKAAGGEEGLFRLVDSFYNIMENDPEFKVIREMHPQDLPESIDKLARFLCGWLGGPKLYSEKYGSIRIPVAHSHLDVTDIEKDLWLACMEKAIEQQDYSGEFNKYLLEQLFVPAERIRQACEKNRV